MIFRCDVSSGCAMVTKSVVSTALLVVSIGCMTLGGAAAIAADKTTGKNWKAPRTADGQPDLQGNWTNATLTPMEREAKYGDSVISAEEARASKTPKPRPMRRPMRPRTRNWESRICRMIAAADLPA